MFALRRNPPTVQAPYATAPPTIRIPYVWFLDTDPGEEGAVVMLMGDKTALGNHWYPTKVESIETVLIREWEHHHPSHKALTRRTR